MVPADSSIWFIVFLSVVGSARTVRTDASWVITRRWTRRWTFAEPMGRGAVEVVAPGCRGALGDRGLGQQAELAGAHRRLGAVGGTELVEDVRGVLLDRVERHVQLVGDLLVLLAGRQQVQHL